ncbi:MAG TPA: glucose 1-dehydrogenase [Thermoanaerobaculia bacterium]|nr:glucose 1-dehydrogenase [Thermoanaerobaculia bacterium]
MGKLDGRNTVVTGGGSGIGAAIARRFAAEGASVVVADRREDAARAVAEEIGASAVSATADVSREDSMREMIDGALSRLGRLDVLVNNAGIGERAVPIEEKSAADWQRVIDTNLSSVFYGIKHAARVMKASGRGGVIVNVSSILGSVGFKGAPAYVAAKHGIQGLTKAAALELAPFGIRVVAVQPAFVHTPLVAAELEAAVLPLHPIGRIGEPEEVAALVTFLASDEAGFMTGAGYLIDGAYTAQ